MSRMDGLVKSITGGERRKAQMMQSCLTLLKNNVLIADENDILTYVNEASVKNLADLTPKIREVFPDFDVNKVLGSSIHVFHKNPDAIRKVLRNLKEGETHSAHINIGDLTLELNVGGAFRNGKRIGSYAEWRDITEELKTSAQAGIMNSCLTSLDNNVMIADENDILTYANNATHKNLTALAPEIRKTFPNFDPNKIIGASIHGFHKDPDAVKKVLHALQPGQIHTADIKIGKLTLRLNVGPVFEGEKRMGSYAEWRDVTAELAMEREKAFVEKKVNEVSVSMNDAVRDISQGNLNLSERTEAQAASIEETTAAMQQVTERVNDNANNAKKAIELVSSAHAAASQGGEVVERAIKAMEEINASSEKINDIIGVIDEIAFQTNLLALNAAVEAARAGEQGRGFAVVASEVRALAGRSGKAAKEIKDLITESVVKVKGGSNEVNETGKCLQDIIDSVQSVTEMVKDISDSSQEQAVSISEINKTVTQMDSFTQQNAALVEEAASASKELESQSNNLLRIVRGEVKDDGVSAQIQGPDGCPVSDNSAGV